MGVSDGEELGSPVDGSGVATLGVAVGLGVVGDAEGLPVGLAVPESSVNGGVGYPVGDSLGESDG